MEDDTDNQDGRPYETLMPNLVVLGVALTIGIILIYYYAIDNGSFAWVVVTAYFLMFSDTYIKIAQQILGRKQ